MATIVAELEKAHYGVWEYEGGQAESYDSLKKMFMKPANSIPVTRFSSRKVKCKVI